MRTPLTLLLPLTLLVAVALLCGCENNSNTADSDQLNSAAPTFALTPANAVVGTNTTIVTLYIDGGEAPFAWSTSDPTLGMLTGETNGTSRYVNYRPTDGVVGVNVVRVTDKNRWIAESTVQHRNDRD